MRALLLALVFLGGCFATAKPAKPPAAEKAEKKPKKKKSKKPAKEIVVGPEDEPAVEETEPPPGEGVLEVFEGHAVWYGDPQPTASGERFDPNKMTAAHRDLPMGTIVRVTNKRNGKSVELRINDRGPYGKDRRRIIDVSKAAAKALNFIKAGWTEVTIEVLSKPPPKEKKKKKKK